MNPQFTSRELDVLRLLAKASQRKNIAAILEITVSTVDDHIHNLQLKTKTHTMAELVRFAVAYPFQKKM